MDARLSIAALAAITAVVATAASAAPPRLDEPDMYTVVASDRDPATLVAHMGVTRPDAYREILFWNPQLHNVHALEPGQRLHYPGAGARPAFPAFTTDYSQWKVIATHTTRFTGSPPERVTNIVTAANALNNFFNDGAHPYVLPRDSLSLLWLIGDITVEKGYVWGHAIGFENGETVDIPALGGGICQLPSTIFPALIKAGLDVTVRQNHSYYPYFYWGYPEGYGFDATIQPPYTDLVWRNLYDLPVRLWARADLARSSLTIDVWAPPNLVPYATEVVGPLLVTDEGYLPASEAGWVWWAARTVVRQRMRVDGLAWDRAFWSYYVRDPYR